MTLNALYRADGIPCLISDHLVTDRDTGNPIFLTRKSEIISNDLVVAAAGSGRSSAKVIEQITDRFGGKPVKWGSLHDFLATLKDLEDPCTIIGWVAEGRKKARSFKWNSTRPSCPTVRCEEIVDGSGDAIYKFVRQPVVGYPGRDQVENAIALCAERAATLWVNDVVYGTLEKACCGGGFDLYVRDPDLSAFRSAGEIGCVYVQLYHRRIGGRVRCCVFPRFSYIKMSSGSVTVMQGNLPYVRIRKTPIESRYVSGVDRAPLADTGLEAKIYVCAFIVQDRQNGLILVDTHTAFGAFAEQFKFDFVPGYSPASGLLLSHLAPSVIREMAEATTKRFQDMGIDLICR